MRVGDLMSTPVFTCRPEDSLAAAAQLMWEHDCGVIPVVDAEMKACAAITDRDICMAAYTRGARLSDVPVSAAMSNRIVTCKVEDDLTVASRKMASAAVRRLPVVDKDGRVCGVLALNDIAMAAERDKTAAAETLKVLIASCRHGVTASSGQQLATGISGSKAGFRS